jgi:hypothetical protein
LHCRGGVYSRHVGRLEKKSLLPLDCASSVLIFLSDS